MNNKEYRRGHKAATQYFSKFRSFKKDESGRIIGYKKSGSTEVIGKPSKERLINPFHKGWRDAERNIIKSKPVRKQRKSSSSSFFGVGRMPKW